MNGTPENNFSNEAMFTINNYTNLHNVLRQTKDKMTFLLRTMQISPKLVCLRKKGPGLDFDRSLLFVSNTQETVRKSERNMSLIRAVADTNSKLTLQRSEKRLWRS